MCSTNFKLGITLLPNSATIQQARRLAGGELQTASEIVTGYRASVRWSPGSAWGGTDQDHRPSR